MIFFASFEQTHIVGSTHASDQLKAVFSVYNEGSGRVHIWTVKSWCIKRTLGKEDGKEVTDGNVFNVIWRYPLGTYRFHINPIAVCFCLSMALLVCFYVYGSNYIPLLLSLAEDMVRKSLTSPLDVPSSSMMRISLRLHAITSCSKTFFSTLSISSTCSFFT